MEEKDEKKAKRKSTATVKKTFIRGKVTARPDRASGPSPGICPIKILSTILYKEDAVMAMMPGTAYLLRRLPTFSVPNSVGAR